MNVGVYLQYVHYFLQMFLLVIIFTPWFGWLASRLNIYDLPPSMRKPSADRKRHLDKPPVPQFGGVSVLLFFILLTLVYCGGLPNILWLIIPVTILLVMGIVDDIVNLSPRTQFLFHFLAAFVFILAPNSIKAINLLGLNIVIPLDFWAITANLFGVTIQISFLSDIIVMIWIVVVINAVKWTGGTDALMEGNVLIAAIILFIISVRFRTYTTAVISILLVGGLLAYIIYNFYPRKINTGSSGKSVYGFIIAALAVFTGAKFAVTLVVLALPLLDAVFVIYQRIREEKPKNLRSLLRISDQRHFHYKLLHLGFSESKIALIEYIINFSVGIVVSFLNGLWKFAFVLTVFVALASMIIYVYIVHKRKTEQSHLSHLTK